MAVGVVPFGIIAPKDENNPPPFVMDESVPHPKDPSVVRRELMEKFQLVRAKNKRPDERNLSDQIVLVQDRLNNMKPHVCYLA